MEDDNVTGTDNAPSHPRPGQTWISRDRRDEGMQVRVLAVDDTHVTIKRFRKTRVRRDRFLRDYRFGWGV